MQAQVAADQLSKLSDIVEEQELDRKQFAEVMALAVRAAVV